MISALTELEERKKKNEEREKKEGEEKNRKKINLKVLQIKRPQL